MMRSMFAGVSGLKTHQTRMDVIGNNIANVNTAGYKAARATFQEMLTQTLRRASAPTSDRGELTLNKWAWACRWLYRRQHTQGNIQPTGYITDLAIEGEGFFILEGENRLYTRNGMFGLDRGRDATEDGSSDGGEEAVEGSLISLVSGHRVLGYKANSDGVIDPNAKLEPLYISASEGFLPKPPILCSSGILTLVRARQNSQPNRASLRLTGPRAHGDSGSPASCPGQCLAVEHACLLPVTASLEQEGSHSKQCNVQDKRNNGGFELIDDSDPQDIKVLAKSSDGLVWTIEDPDNPYTFELSKQITTDDLDRSDNNVIVVRTASSGNGLYLPQMWHWSWMKRITEIMERLP